MEGSFRPCGKGPPSIKLLDKGGGNEGSYVTQSGAEGMLVGLRLGPLEKWSVDGTDGTLFLLAAADPEPRRKDKKLVMVPGDLVDQLMRLAGREGKPLSTFVQEQLEQVVRARNLGAPLKDIVNFYEIMEELKSAGAMFTPSEVMKFLVGEVFPRQGEELRGKWYEAGQWYGKYLMAKFPDQVDALGRLLRATRWDLDEVKITRRGREVEVRCIANGLSLEETDALCNFVEGSMDSLGYGAKKKDCVRGIVHLVFEEGGAARG